MKLPPATQKLAVEHDTLLTEAVPPRLSDAATSLSVCITVDAPVLWAGASKAELVRVVKARPNFKVDRSRFTNHSYHVWSSLSANKQVNLAIKTIRC